MDLSTLSALGQGTDSLAGIENVNGSANADQLYGNAGPNTIQGFGGND